MDFTAQTFWFVIMLLAPFLLALGLLFLVQSVDQPLQNDAVYQQGNDPSPSAEARVRDRVSIMVILEVFALTLIIRPWQFPWTAKRFLIAEVILFIWGALMIPMAMHTGRLLALHALGLMGLLGFLLPVAILTLFIRDIQ